MAEFKMHPLASLHELANDIATLERPDSAAYANMLRDVIAELEVRRPFQEGTASQEEMAELAGIVDRIEHSESAKEHLERITRDGLQHVGQRTVTGALMVGSDLEVRAYKTGNALCLIVNKGGMCVYRATLEHAYDDMLRPAQGSDLFVVRDLRK